MVNFRISSVLDLEDLRSPKYIGATITTTATRLRRFEPKYKYTDPSGR